MCAARQGCCAVFFLTLMCAFLLQPPDKVQLVKEEQALEDARKLSDLKVENDDVVAMCYVQGGGQHMGQLRAGWDECSMGGGHRA